MHTNLPTQHVLSSHPNKPYSTAAGCSRHHQVLQQMRDGVFVWHTQLVEDAIQCVEACWVGQYAGMVHQWAADLHHIAGEPAYAQQRTNRWLLRGWSCALMPTPAATMATACTSHHPLIHAAALRCADTTSRPCPAPPVPHARAMTLTCRTSSGC